MRNRLRYWLTHHPQLALWHNASEPEELIGGLVAWQTKHPRRKWLRQAWLQLRHTDPAAFLQKVLAGLDPQDIRPGEWLLRIFTAVNEPVTLDELVELAVVQWGKASELSAAVFGADTERLAARQTSIVTELEQRAYLRQLWEEIIELPHLQRVALLLNLRLPDGEGAIALLPLMGVATMRELAQTLDIPLSELQRLWPALPLDDRAVAERLQLTRQQVINLRKAARARLARRMRDK